MAIFDNRAFFRHGKLFLAFNQKRASPKTAHGVKIPAGTYQHQRNNGNESTTTNFRFSIRQCIEIHSTRFPFIVQSVVCIGL